MAEPQATAAVNRNDGSYEETRQVALSYWHMPPKLIIPERHAYCVTEGCANRTYSFTYDAEARFKFIHYVYYVVTCKDGHSYFICKFCDKKVGSWMLHNTLCEEKIGRKFIMRERINVGIDNISGNSCGVTWYIPMWEVLDRIPQLLMLDTYFDELINDNFVAELMITMNRMRGSTESFCRLYTTNLIPKCVLCKQYYDSFPTDYECRVHINSPKCSYIQV